MADEPIVAPPGGIAPEPAAAASSPPAAAPAAAPEPVVAAPAPEPARSPAPVEPAAPAVEPTLLQIHDAEAAAAAASKPAEAPKPAEPAKPAVAAEAPKPAEPAAAPPAEPVEPAAPPALAPVEYAYELPETIKLDDATRTSFHSALDAFRQDPVTGTQGLIDLHNKTMTDYAEHVANEQRRVWNETRKGWQTEVMADEQLGGAGYQTTMGAIARMRDLLVPEDQRGAFDSFLQITGAGDHPAFLRVMHNAARIFDEAPLPPPDPRPAPNGGKPPTGRLRDMYKTAQPRG